jgi:hypothetical protein
MLGKKAEHHPTWKGGANIDADGYRRVYAPNHPWPRPRNYIKEHIIVMELHIGRRLEPGEAVHHKDENKLNNSIENLELMTNSEHMRHHVKKWAAEGRRIGIARKNNVAGVNYHPHRSASRPWRAQISVGRQRIHLGIFATEGEAVTARRAAELKYYGKVFSCPSPAESA